jgi:hypothetical protein
VRGQRNLTGTRCTELPVVAPLGPKLVRPVTGLVADTIRYAAVTGTGNPIRISPLLDNTLYACRFSSMLETSAFRHVALSTSRNIGSFP